MKILKYRLGKGKFPFAVMPVDARIVAVQPQGDLVTIWAEVSGNADYADRHFVCLSTGESIPEGCSYLGTCQFHSGATVVHVFSQEAS